MWGVWLLLTHPRIADVDCGHCLEVIYDFDPQSKGYAQPVKSRKKDGSYYRRHAGAPPPCRTERGCPKGTPERSRALTPQNQAAYEHYLECRAVGQFPDDPIVRANAAVIAAAEKMVADLKQDKFQTLLVTLMTGRRR
jgi:hypothetical protein